MFKKTKVSKAMMLAFGGSLALSALPALAQQAAQLERVEVTGSSIKRLAAEQSLPVTVIKAEDLAKAGVINAEQAMSSSPPTSRPRPRRPPSVRPPAARHLQTCADWVTSAPWCWSTASGW